MMEDGEGRGKREEGLVVYMVAGKVSNSIEVFRSPVIRYVKICGRQ